MQAPLTRLDSPRRSRARPAIRRSGNEDISSDILTFFRFRWEQSDDTAIRMAVSKSWATLHSVVANSIAFGGANLELSSGSSPEPGSG